MARTSMTSNSRSKAAAGKGPDSEEMWQACGWTLTLSLPFPEQGEVGGDGCGGAAERLGEQPTWWR